MVRDYDPTTRYNDLLDRVLRHRDAIISHLNWAASSRYVFRYRYPITPVFAQWIQNTHALAPGATAPGATASTSLTWGAVISSSGRQGSFVTYSIRNRGFFGTSHHAFTIHVTVLILLKGVLFARSSRLIPDKANLGFRFPCDGPGRGGHVKYQLGTMSS
uniref:Putative photosystem I PsaA/PsaB n=1 Tax=Helianthus annuus TaxID=4232 RepID=A0A1Y3BZH5_HELAN